MSGDVLESHLFSHFCCPAASLTKDIPSRHDMEATLMKSQPYDLLSKNSTMTLQGNISRKRGTFHTTLPLDEYQHACSDIKGESVF